jgi:hypothetical protein
VRLGPSALPCVLRNIVCGPLVPGKVLIHQTVVN